MTEMKYCGKPLIHTGEVIQDSQQASLHDSHSPYLQAIKQYGQGKQWKVACLECRPGRRSETLTTTFLIFGRAKLRRPVLHHHLGHEGCTQIAG